MASIVISKLYNLNLNQMKNYFSYQKFTNTNKDINHNKKKQQKNILFTFLIQDFQLNLFTNKAKNTE